MEKYTSLQDIKNVMSRLNELQEKSSNELTIDINEVLENLSSYECDQYIYDWGYCDCDYDENCEDCGGDGEYEEKMLVSEWVERMEFDGMLNEVKHDNTYNYNSPISNHVDFRILQKNHDSEVIVELKVHMFGDVRANYTENIYLEFANEYEFFEAFQTSKAVTFEHNEKIYNVDFDVFSDSKEVYDENYNHLLTSYEYDLNNIKKQIEDNE